MKEFSRLKSVFHVDGLEANIISISHICDLDLYVNFTREKCSVMDNYGNCVLKRFRYFENCYTLAEPHTCHHVSINHIDFFHEKLSHLNYDLV